MDTTTLAYRILEFTGISGEVSPDTLCQLSASKSYAEKVITSLKEQKLLRLHYKDKLRGLRLTQKGKKTLLAVNASRFQFFLTGNSDTNQPRSAYSRRLRLHQSAAVYLSMLQANICIFRDEKPLLFEPGIPPPSHLSGPSFYHSRELKSLGTETIKINNSRAMGVLLTSDSVYVIYYTGDHVLKWDYKTEVKLRTLLTHHLRSGVLSSLYMPSLPVKALILGSNMNIAFQLMTGIGGSKERYFYLDQSYEYFHYLPNDKISSRLLKFISDPVLPQKLRELLLSDLSSPDLQCSIPHDAKTADGKLVLLGYDFDMLRIKQFMTGISLWDMSGDLICFDFQKDILSKMSTASVTLTTIDFTKFERRFFPV